MRENYTLTRLFVTSDLETGTELSLAREQAHYLGTVLRKSIGGELRVFNGRDGEWRPEITALSKKSAQLKLIDLLRSQTVVPDITLLFAPVRKHRTAFIIEKATELGVRKLQPVQTTRTQFPRFNVEKAHLQAGKRRRFCLQMKRGMRFAWIMLSNTLPRQRLFSSVQKAASRLRNAQSYVP